MGSSTCLTGLTERLCLRSNSLVRRGLKESDPTGGRYWRRATFHQARGLTLVPALKAALIGCRLPSVQTPVCSTSPCVSTVITFAANIRLIETERCIPAATSVHLKAKRTGEPCAPLILARARSNGSTSIAQLRGVAHFLLQAAWFLRET